MKPTVEQIRAYYPGAIGGREIAEYATDAEIQCLADLHDQSADLTNQASEIVCTIHQIQKSILMRKKGDDATAHLDNAGTLARN